MKPQVRAEMLELGTTGAAGAFRVSCERSPPVRYGELATQDGACSALVGIWAPGAWRAGSGANVSPAHTHAHTPPPRPARNALGADS